MGRVLLRDLGDTAIMERMSSHRYRILSLSGTPLSEHRTLHEAASKVAKANAWQEWSIARVGAGGRSVQLNSDERREVNAIKYPALTEYDGEPPA